MPVRVDGDGEITGLNKVEYQEIDVVGNEGVSVDRPDGSGYFYRGTNGAATKFEVQADGTTVVRNDSGVAEIILRPDGNAKFAGGVKIGGTAAANEIEEYEEGTFVPVIKGSTTDPVYTTSNELGKYVRVGGKVTAWALITVSSVQSQGSGSIQISLPFAATGFTYSQVGLVGYNDVFDVETNKIFLQESNSNAFFVPDGVTQSAVFWDDTNLSSGYLTYTVTYDIT